MKVLYLHQYFATPESNAGTRSYEIAKRLIKKGHQVTFITTSAFLSDSYDLKSGWNFLEIEGFNLFVLHLPYSNKDSFFKRVITFLQFCFRSSFKVLSIKCDVVFATSTPLTIAIPGIIYSLFKSKPMVFEVRDLWPELPVAIGAIKNPFIIYVAKLLEKAAYMQSEKIIGLSPGMCEGIAKHNISADKIVLASNSCDTELFNVHPFIGVSYKQDKLSFVGDRKLVVYTGTLGKINDVSYIVYLAECAMSLQLNICFIVMGTGMEKNKIVALAKTVGVMNVNFYMLDPVPKLEVVKLLSIADLSLSLFAPIKEMWNNSANKFFDALASNTPVAINYCGWQEELINSSGCGIVLNSSDHKSSVLTINEFLFNDQKYSDAKVACLELANDKFSRDNIAEKIINTLHDAANA